MKRILDRYPDIATRYLLVAEGGVYAKPTAVTTVLGSCVTVTFHCPRQRMGAAFHALLPRQADYERDTPGIQVFRYVDTAVAAICDKLAQLGVRRQDIACKIFGGANAMFQHEISVGPKNVQAAFETLAGFPLRITATNVGGNQGRKLLFITHTGEVFIKQLANGPQNQDKR
jgi:chemotaxis protein CheD